MLKKAILLMALISFCSAVSTCTVANATIYINDTTEEELVTELGLSDEEIQMVLDFADEKWPVEEYEELYDSGLSDETVIRLQEDAGVELSPEEEEGRDSIGANEEEFPEFFSDEGDSGVEFDGVYYDDEEYSDFE